ncbi:MAG: hypothetical protein HKL90_08125 [Elusimicrobia bacterium]|nr:hypothetical protein [Elusimicrobiota bacterium]
MLVITISVKRPRNPIWRRGEVPPYLRMAGAIRIFPIVSGFLQVRSFADDSFVEIQGGAATSMEKQSRISMSDEYVLIDMRPKSYRVKALFHFFNHGASTTVAVGFPAGGSGAEGVKKQDFPYFRTWVDGEVAATKDVPDEEYGDSAGGYSFYKVKQVYFPALSTTTSVVEYEAPYGMSSNAEYWIRYPYGTGGTWAGPIHKAVFDLRFDETTENSLKGR